MFPLIFILGYLYGRKYVIEIDNQKITITLRTVFYKKQVYFYEFEYHEPIEVSMCYSYSDEDDNSPIFNKYYLILNCYNCKHILFEIYFLWNSVKYKEMLLDIDFIYHGEPVRIINKGAVLYENLENIPHI